MSQAWKKNLKWYTDPLVHLCNPTEEKSMDKVMDQMLLLHQEWDVPIKALYLIHCLLYHDTVPKAPIPKIFTYLTLQFSLSHFSEIEY